MSKVCEICGCCFVDNTKNKNRLLCSSVECKKHKAKKYASKVSIESKRKSTAKFKIKNPNYLNQWRNKNKQRDLELNRVYKRERYKNDLNFRLAVNLRNRFHRALKFSRSGSPAIKELGCSLEEFKKYLESRFEPDMTWNNYGKWHIDHIIALANFDLTNEKEFKKACHYTNLQPLWAYDNRSKGSKYVSV